MKTLKKSKKISQKYSFYEKKRETGSLIENLKKIQFNGGKDSINTASNIDKYLYGK